MNRRPGYRVVVLSEEDGSSHELRLPGVVSSIGLGLSIVAAIAISFLMVLAGAYVNALNHTGKQASQIAHLTATVRQQNRMAQAYHRDQALSDILNRDTSSLLKALKTAEAKVGIIDGYATPGAQGLQGMLDVLTHVQTVLPQTSLKAASQATYLAHRPNELPVYGTIASPFGWRKSPMGGLGTEFHDGVDIAVHIGTPVRAVADGVIAYAGWYYGYGNYVLIDHGYGIQTFYGHNSKILVHLGEVVHRGQLIALSGDTGNSTGPHVHFGLHVWGVPTNPLTFIHQSGLPKGE